MNTSIARVTISSITPMSQSRQHDEPRLQGEQPEDYDQRTWRSKLNTGVRDGKPTVVIPAHGLHQAIAAAAKYSHRKIPGKGAATWSKKFLAGIALLEDPALHIAPDSVEGITISANVDGIRGNGRRVPRRFPIIPTWSSTFEVVILDPIITEELFKEFLSMAGMFIGIGRFRPEKGGTNGRFKVDAVEWTDNRQAAA